MKAADGLGRKIRRSVLAATFEMPLRDSSGIIKESVFLGLDIQRLINNKR